MSGLLSTPRKQHSNGAYTQDIDSNALASTRLNQILNKDSDLMKTSKTKGLQIANSRGLLNSSIAAETGTKAMIDSATPIAQSDAANTLTQSLANQGALNEFGLMGKQQAWQSGENALNRGHDLTMQKNDQSWRSGESALDRGHDLTKQGNEFNWRSGESALDRGQQRWMQENNQNFLRDMNTIDWDNKFKLMDTEQGYKKDILDDQQQHETSENVAQRTWQTGERQNTQDWSSGESALDREHAFNFLNAQTDSNLALQNDAQEWAKIMQDDSQVHALDMFDRGAMHDENMARINGAIESGLISQQVGANIQGSLIASLNDTQELFNRQAFDIMNNPNMDSDTKSRYMRDMFGAWEVPKVNENGEPVLDENGQQVMDQVPAGTEGATRYKGMIDYRVEDIYAVHDVAPEMAWAWGQVASGNNGDPQEGVLVPMDDQAYRIDDPNTPATA